MNTWGGKRNGAGRPLERGSFGDRKAKHSLYCTYYELAMAREFLILLREKKYKATIDDCGENLNKKLEKKS